MATNTALFVHRVAYEKIIFDKDIVPSMVHRMRYSQMNIYCGSAIRSSLQCCHMATIDSPADTYLRKNSILGVEDMCPCRSSHRSIGTLDHTAGSRAIDGHIVMC